MTHRQPLAADAQPSGVVDGGAAAKPADDSIAQVAQQRNHCRNHRDLNYPLARSNGMPVRFGEASCEPDIHTGPCYDHRSMSAKTITREQVLHVAELARIELSEEEIERLGADLGEMLEYVE